MKYNGDNTTESFCDQFDTVLSLFTKWNDCERTVVLCALLKRIPYSNLKFLQLLSEHSLSQAYKAQSKVQILESNSNNPVFLKELLSRYKALSETVLHEDNGLKFMERQEKKEEILNDMLLYLPLLNPGNNETKMIYMNLIPFMVDDSIKHLVSAEVTQQIFSYLLIHPAINSEDRKLISQWLRHLQNHMSGNLNKPQIFTNKFYPSIDSSSASSLSPSSWQTIASPMENASWDLQNIKISQDYCDEISKSLSNNNIGNTCGNSARLSHRHENSVSFSNEIRENAHIKQNLSINNINSECASGFLTVPGFEANLLKTRRSHSLTTSGPDNTHSSVENLGNGLQKPRSFSLSMDSSSTNCGPYQLRLDDPSKPYVRFSSKIGMNNIGQWLKSLRLHKYIWIFYNYSYEQMLDISETDLEAAGVTKGARNKLVLCIQKLKDRMNVLIQMENDFNTGTKQVHPILEELTNIVLTPMKPIGMHPEDDIAGQLFKVVDQISAWIELHYTQALDDALNTSLWILEKLIHNEAFLAQINLLKEHKFKLTKIKSQYLSDAHCSKKLSVKNIGNKSRY